MGALLSDLAAAKASHSEEHEARRGAEVASKELRKERSQLKHSQMELTAELKVRTAP